MVELTTTNAMVNCGSWPAATLSAVLLLQTSSRRMSLPPKLASK